MGLLSLKSVRFSYFNNALVIIVKIFCSLLFHFYVNNLFNENRFRTDFRYHNHKFLEILEDFLYHENIVFKNFKNVLYYKI